MNTIDKKQQIKDLKKSALTWDVYSIAILFVTMLNNLQIDVENYDFMKQYMEILNETIFSDPTARPPIKTIVEKITAIFTSSIETDSYQSFLNSLSQKEEPKETKTTNEDNTQLLEEVPETILGVGLAEEL